MIASTLALVFSLAALCLGGAIAGGVFVTSRQIKNGTILSQDIHSGGVRSSDIANGTVSSGDIGTGQVDSSDIGNGDVTPQDVTMPPPDQLSKDGVSTGTWGYSDTTYRLLDDVGSYSKEAADSELEVDWTGTVSVVAAPCLFQIRVDGQPSGPGQGIVYQQQGTSSVSATALFDGLPTGPHEIEVWALGQPGANPVATCKVGSVDAGIPQTFVISEQVV